MAAKRNPGAGGSGVRNSDHVGTLISFEITPGANVNQAKIPSRAALARRFPKLKINRLSWRWCDDASGARGDDVESLIAFLEGGANG